MLAPVLSLKWVAAMIDTLNEDERLQKREGELKPFTESRTANWAAELGKFVAVADAGSRIFGVIFPKEKH
jgi:hypothetical protein